MKPSRSALAITCGYIAFLRFGLFLKPARRQPIRTHGHWRMPNLARMAGKVRLEIHIRENWATYITDFCQEGDNPETKD
jgi:hypothetical protein